MDKNYQYEAAMLEVLNECFQKFRTENEHYRKRLPNMSEEERQRESKYIDGLMDFAIAQKELVEAVIGECVNLQKDGHIRIGVDDPIDYEVYLESIKPQEAEKEL